MQMLFVAAFIAILGIITVIPTSVGRNVIRKTESLIVRPTSTPVPTVIPTTASKTVEVSPTVHPSPTLQIKPIIRREDDEEE